MFPSHYHRVCALAAYCPVSFLTDVFPQSGAFVELEVLRCWPLSQDSSVDPPTRVLRIEAQDFRRGAATAAAAAAAGHPPAINSATPIEVFLYGAWANIQIEKFVSEANKSRRRAPRWRLMLILSCCCLLRVCVQDVLRICRALVQPSSSDADHPWRLVFAEDPSCADASLTVRGWKARMLLREGREYTLEILAREQEEAEEAAAVQAEKRAAEMAAQKQAAAEGKVPANKKAKLSKGAAAAASSSSSVFQTAASLAAGSASAPILLDDSTGAAAASSASGADKKKRKCGAEIHGAYAYTPLGEVRHRPKEKLNFYGVVLLAPRPAKPTQGKDWVCSVVVTDMTMPSPNEGITFNIFRRTAEALPPPTVAKGDIVRFHRAQVGPHTSDKLVGVLSGGTGFLFIKGGLGEPMEPFFNPSDTYSTIDADIVRSLREWSHKYLAFASPAHHTFTRLDSFAQMDKLDTPFFDCHCAIICTDLTNTMLQRIYSGKQVPVAAAAAAAGASTGAAAAASSSSDSSSTAPPSPPLAYIWDGTDLPRSLRLQRGLLPNGMEIPSTSADARQQALSFSARATGTPRFGSIIPIALFGAIDQFSPPGLPHGKPIFAHLRNIALTRGPDGLSYLQFTKYSRFMKLEQSDTSIDAMLKSVFAAHDKLHESCWLGGSAHPRRPSCCVVCWCVLQGIHEPSHERVGSFQIPAVELCASRTTHRSHSGAGEHSTRSSLQPDELI